MITCDVLIVGGGIVGTYLARSCAEKGLRVCLVEKGGPADGAPDTFPPIQFSARKNLAAIEARNHLLGGNSRFWGGALVEDDGELIEALGVTGAARVEFSKASEIVYSKIGIRRTGRSKMPGKGECLATLCEFPVLTGKYRNIWSGSSERFSEEGIQFFLNSELISVSTADGKNTALIRGSAGDEEKVRFSSLIVSAGVVDSIRLLAKLFPDLNSEGLGLGRNMNDHLSLSVASFPWRRTPVLEQLFPPRFDKSVTVGRRLEFVLPDSGVKGFIHLQAPYDEVEPYRSLKRLVFARQRGLSLKEILLAAFSLLKGGVTTMRVGLDRFLKNCLFYPEGAQVSLLVDIESGAETEKSLNLSGDYVLNWQLSDADILHLREASLLALDLLGPEVLGDESLLLLREIISSPSFIDSVETRCTEALHLGGGLQGLLTPLPKSGLKCQVSTELPVYVISTAIFPRAGIANPVQTLLVCAELLSIYFDKNR